MLIDHVPIGRETQFAEVGQAEGAALTRSLGGRAGALSQLLPTENSRGGAGY